MFNHRLLIQSCLLAAATATGVSAQAVEKPNVVVLFADDAGYADFGFQPNCDPEFKKLTPHIDSIAANGARVTDGYVSAAVCSPSRAGLMTGRYQERFGHDNNLPPGFKSGLPLSETFGVKRLQGLGYKTGLIGKWHLGYPEEFHPNKRGYDDFWGLLQGSRSYYPYEKPTAHRRLQHNGVTKPEGGYVTDRFGDAACEFIEKHQADPFYLFVSFTAPHGPLQPRKDDVDGARIKHIETKRRRNNAGLIAALDDNVGKVLQALKDNDLLENTLVIFTNDNGGALHTGANNDPLEGGKGEFYEGGIRVPWAMQWPAVIPKESVLAQPLTTLDILPTVVEMSGNEVDPEWRLDGASFLPYLRQPSADPSPRELYWRQSGSAGPVAMRQGNWKLVYRRNIAGAKPELYNLANDISESKDLANDNPGQRDKMISQLEAWESEMVEPLWGPGTKGKPVSDTDKKKKREEKEAKKD